MPGGRPVKNKVGIRSGRLVVLSLFSQSPEGRAYWLCQCDCGNTKVIFTSHIGKTKSCGCIKAGRKPTHGMTKTNTYKSWLGMRKRCYKVDHHKYPLYGGRGIKVCKRWLNSFENFLEDMGERPEGMTLDRIDGNKDYKPSNCRWATPLEQRHNRA